MNFIDVWRSLVCFQDSFAAGCDKMFGGCNGLSSLDFGCLIRKIAADDFLSLGDPPGIKRDWKILH